MRNHSFNTIDLPRGTYPALRHAGITRTGFVNTYETATGFERNALLVYTALQSAPREVEDITGLINCNRLLERTSDRLLEETSLLAKYAPRLERAVAYQARTDTDRAFCLTRAVMMVRGTVERQHALFGVIEELQRDLDARIEALEGR